MPFLAFTYYLGCPKEKFSKIILLALVFGCLGDIFLNIRNLFVFGVASFLIGHLLYIFLFFGETGFKNFKKNIFVFIGVCIVYLYAENKVLLYFRPALIKAGVWGPLIVYTSIIATLNVSSAIYAYCYRNIYSFLTYIGSLVFFISDVILAQQIFMEDNKYYSIIIMTTYILGQSLISLGMANKKNSTEFNIIKDSIKKMI
jgi:uncharacterized membrane protein YhhN